MRILLFFLISTCCFAQQEFTGLVKDISGNTIEQVVVIVSDSLSQQTPENILISDSLGAFKVSLNSNKKYVLKTKHLSFKDTIVGFNPAKENKISIFLSPNNHALEEVIIKHEKPKVKVRRDTISFNLSKYIDDNDRKLKDLVEKLPGLTIQEDGSLYFKGEKITKLLVENEEFFGGGTKLGLENIPADALEKLEVISNYSKSNLLKSNRRTEQQVINLVLKKDRKSIIFGNVSGGSDFSNFYEAQASFFQFKRKNQNNLIVNANNIAQQLIGNNEAEAFSNINSELFNLIETPIAYGIDKNEFSKIDNKIVALNAKRISKNSTWDFLSYYNLVNKEKSFTEKTEYLNNNSIDTRQEFENIQNKSFYFRATNYLKNTKKERLFANAIVINNDTNLNKTASFSGLGNRDYTTSDVAENLSINSVFEEVLALADNETLVYGSNLSYTNSNENNLLASNQGFLEEQIPWLDQSLYSLDKTHHKSEFNVQLGAIYYYNLNQNNTLSASNKTSYDLANLTNNQNQLLENESAYYLGSNFNSKLRFHTMQSDFKLNYNYKKDNWNIDFGGVVHMFSLKIKKYNLENTSSEIVFNPFTNIRYFINTKKQITFNYNSNINLPKVNQLDDYYAVNNYNTVTIGNTDLNKSITQNFVLKYTDYNIPKNYSFNSISSFQIFKNTLEKSYIFNDINSVSTYYNQAKNGFNFRSRNSFFYLFNTWEAGVSLTYSESVKHIDLVKTQEVTNKRINFSPRFKTNFKALPNIYFKPYLAYNSQKVGLNSRDFKSKGFQSKIEYHFLSNFLVKTAYNYSEIANEKAFSSLDFEFRFTNKLKYLDISLNGYNVLATRFNTSILQSSLFRVENISTNLGRSILFKVNYFF